MRTVSYTGIKSIKSLIHSSTVHKVEQERQRRHQGPVLGYVGLESGRAYQFIGTQPVLQFVPPVVE